MPPLIFRYAKQMTIVKNNWQVQSCIFLARFQVSTLSIHTLYDRWISQPYESIKHLPNQPHNRAIFLKEQSISLYGMSTVYGEALRDIEKRDYEGDWQPIGQALNR